MIRLLAIFVLVASAGAAELPGFRRSPHFNEQVREEWHDGGVRISFNAAAFDPKLPTRLVIYATPNGNTIEQTLGCGKAVGLDWHYDIQHVAAQVRRYRDFHKDENVVLAVVEAGGLSWPSYRAKFKDNPDRIGKLVEIMLSRIPAKEVKITLTGHSGGGSFTSGFLNAHDAIPANVDRIAYLDSNYSYSDDERHGDKLLAWLVGDKARRLIAIAYDDREITLDGKKMVGPTGGTWRATQRMLDRMGKTVALETAQRDNLEVHTALEERIIFTRHTNPENKILHTRLVGEMNGLLEALTHGTKTPWPRFPGVSAEAKWIQPAPVIPQPPKVSFTGSRLLGILSGGYTGDREQVIVKSMLAGHLPEFERKFVTVTVKSKDKAGMDHTVSFDVMPDYLALGTDADFLRMPMTPQTATQIADAWGCTLPTAKMVDLIHTAATVKLAPKPLGEPREAVEQFGTHHAIIEEQRKGHTLGELVSGIKKDIVLSNRIHEKPRRLALYGWHKEGGTAIQPLTIVHHDGYVDYSHGVRLVKRTVLLDGKPKEIRDILRDANLAVLLSDEGVLTQPGYE